jgi:antitoxin (DNA-binding transcriptional repressor) of toxin-antitoxin stability system
MERLNVVEARKSFSEIMARIAYGGQRVVIERKGRPMMRRMSASAAAAASRARIRAERNGVPLPDAAETLARLREERTNELLDLR